MAPTPDRWQKIEALYHAAMERSRAERASFLAEVCGDDEVLRREVESLLTETHTGEGLLDRPAAGLRAESGTNTADLKPGFPPGLQYGAQVRSFQDGDVLLERFRIVRFVGHGGMGEVYEATDFHLGRIALKTIRSGVAEGEEGIQRFRREVKLARRVTNTHVCRIHDLFTIPAQGDRPPLNFLTMEYLPGVTLAERIAQSGPLPVGEAEIIALQLCSALQAMHEAGIIHRDIKTRNIMLTPSPAVVAEESAHGPAPHAVVMDFGLAREDTNEDAGITRIGAIMGTPKYMAPEQSLGREVTVTADIYSLGVVLFEMLTGRLPSEVSTAPLTPGTGEPRAKSSAGAGLPEKWAWVIHRCLQVQPELRYQTAKELAEALKGRRLDRKLKAGLAAALIVIGIIALTQLPIIHRLWNSGGASANSARIIAGRQVLIGQIENHTGDPVFEQTIGELLRSTLDQSSAIRVFPAPELTDALRRMGRPETTEISPQLAVDLCQREGLYAAIVGSIARIGSEYVIILKALDNRGAVISSGTETTQSREQVVRAIERISKTIRESLGESTESISATIPLEQVTSPSLQAVQYYSLGRIELSKGKAQNAVNLFQRAIEIDPNFAMAHAYAGIAYEYHGDHISLRKELATAAGLSDHVAEPERLKILGDYALAERNFSEAIKYYQLLSQIKPALAAAHLNMGQAFLGQFNFDRALRETEEAIRLQPGVGSEDNAVEVLFQSGQTAEAVKRAEVLLKLHPDDTRALYIRGRDLMARGETESARKIFVRLSSPGEEEQSTGEAALADLAADRGHPDEAWNYMKNALVADEKAHNSFKIAMWTLQLAAIEQRSERKQVSKSLDLESIQNDERLLIIAANLCTNERNADCLKNVIEKLEVLGGSGESASIQSFLRIVKSNLALIQGQRDDAVAFAESAVQFENSAFAVDNLARVYAALGMDQQAISAYRKVLARGYERMEAYDGPAYHRLREIHQELAGLYLRTGDKKLSETEKALAAR